MQKLSYEKGETNQPLLQETIIQNLRRTVEKHADKEALIVKSQNYRSTYKEFFQEVKSTAKALLKLVWKKATG